MTRFALPATQLPRLALATGTRRQEPAHVVHPHAPVLFRIGSGQYFLRQGTPGGSGTAYYSFRRRSWVDSYQLGAYMSLGDFLEDEEPARRVWEAATALWSLEVL
jgi:hypothetical protein